MSYALYLFETMSALPLGLEIMGPKPWFLKTLKIQLQNCGLTVDMDGSGKEK